jgi:AcrR family transcriptional regulator
MGIVGKLSSEERRAAIIKAVRQVFAEKGFDGTTTRELAEAAGVSEALLFKHFPNKEALFSAMQLACCSEDDLVHYETLSSLEPSASTLALLVHFMVSRSIGSCVQKQDEIAIHNRLMLRSLAADGEFARLFLARLATDWVPKIAECVRAATTAGDTVPNPTQPEAGAWFIYHLATTILFHLLPDTPVVDYGLPRGKLVEQAVRFVLRGAGLTEEAIQRSYNPRALALFDR